MMDPLFHMDSIGLDSLGGSGSMHHGVCDPHMNGLSLQEMIDTDIKAEFDDVLLPSEGGAGFSNMDTLDGLLDSADFKLDDVVGSTTVGGAVGSAVGMHGTGYSSLSYLEDFGPNQGNVLVNPNNVMPCTSVQQQQAQQPSPALSVNTQFTSTGNPASVLSPALSSPAYQQQQIQQLSPIVQQQQTYQQQAVRPQQFIVKPSIVSGTGGGASAKTVKILPPNGSPAMHQQVQGIHAAATVIQSSTAVIATTTGRTKKQQQPKQAEKENGYPKPGYSYSCLIALALKNSHTGHLSVSEIYKFMCEHFPYFKTAPAGWKNSVRHNLSLNKCFEKIEKPSVGGANQRKGCLWAMNPAKINKMDEEVLKWSRKDPMAIKKGMVHPHTLEKLERGEMIKDYNASTTNGGGNGGNDSEDEDDPESPTSISSQSSSQGYDSAGSDFVDIEGFASIPDSSLPELQLQASGNFGGAGSIFEELGDERLQLLDSPVPQHTTQHQPNVTNGGSVYSTSGHQQIVRLATAAPPAPSQARQGGGGGHTYYPTAIHANYAIAPASAGSAATATNLKARTQQTLVVTRQEGPQKVFTVGAPALTS